MKTLDTIKKIPMEIAVTLASNNRLQFLITNDTNENWSENQRFIPYTINELLTNDYISFTPVIDQNITTNKNSFIIINLDEIDFSNRDDNMSTTGSIFIGIDKQHAVLKDNNLRLLEILNQILQSLNNKKLSTTGIINMSYATFVSYSEYVFGYKIVFMIEEQETRKAEI